MTFYVNHVRQWQRENTKKIDGVSLIIYFRWKNKWAMKYMKLAWNPHVHDQMALPNDTWPQPMMQPNTTTQWRGQMALPNNMALPNGPSKWHGQMALPNDTRHHPMMQPNNTAKRVPFKDRFVNRWIRKLWNPWLPKIQKCVNPLPFETVLSIFAISC